MPELPEVETIRRQLAPHLEGREIVAAQILDARWTRPDASEPVAGELRGARVERIERTGKYLIWVLSGDRHLLLHLRMTGTLLFDPPVEPAHTRVRFELDDGGRLVYVDPRRFGTGHLLHGGASRHAYLAERLGVEPFTPAFTAAYLRGEARGRTGAGQSVRARPAADRRGGQHLRRRGPVPRRHPSAAAGGPSDRAQLESLREAIEDALSAGIDAKGASIDDFRHLDGARGSFQDLFLVHRRAGLPCLNCGTTIAKIVVGGRGTYVCERCQPKPRRRS